MFDFLVEVAGDLEHPCIEAAKSSEFRWLGPGDLGLLKENRRGDDTTIMRLAQRALEMRARR